MSDAVFVFGSNLAGRHGAGAARHAAKHFGAEYGVGEGPTGRAYALPTKDAQMVSLSLDAIGRHIGRFLDYARANPDKTFHLTPIGTGLAGHSKRDIFALLRGHAVPSNVLLTSTWVTERTKDER